MTIVVEACIICQQENRTDLNNDSAPQVMCLSDVRPCTVTGVLARSLLVDRKVQVSCPKHHLWRK